MAHSRDRPQNLLPYHSKAGANRLRSVLSNAYTLPAVNQEKSWYVLRRPRDNEPYTLYGRDRSRIVTFDLSDFEPYIDIPPWLKNVQNGSYNQT